jgi:hypothetical protein
MASSLVGSGKRWSNWQPNGPLFGSRRRGRPGDSGAKRRSKSSTFTASSKPTRTTARQSYHPSSSRCSLPCLHHSHQESKKERIGLSPFFPDMSGCSDRLPVVPSATSSIRTDAQPMQVHGPAIVKHAQDELGLLAKQSLCGGDIPLRLCEIPLFRQQSLQL